MSLAYALSLVVATAKVHAITGRVDSVRTGEPLGGALVVLQCTCLDQPIETMTNDEGRYVVEGLPAGTYEVQVLRDQADVSRVVRLGFAK